jgi:hypothetical protein
MCSNTHICSGRRLQHGSQWRHQSLEHWVEQLALLAEIVQLWMRQHISTKVIGGTRRQIEGGSTNGHAEMR